MTYAGDKEERAHLQQDLKQESGFHVLLTTYEVSVCFSVARTLNLGPQKLPNPLELHSVSFFEGSYYGKKVFFH